jgi:hypothetical protein
MRNVLLVTILGLSVAASGCEKAGSKASGPLAGDDLSLLHDLPGGNVALMGGNYMKMQDFMQSTLGKLAQRTMNQLSGDKGFTEWMQCFAEMKQLRMAGGVAFDGDLDMRLAFKGITLQQVDACAKRAGFSHTLDPDGKYIAVGVPVLADTVEQGYLLLPDGAVYSRQRMKLGLGAKVTPATRGELEADMAAAAKASAADDKALVALAAKVDRSRTVWFAGSAANTPAASKVGDVYGTVDIDAGLKMNITVVFKDGELASQIESGLAQARKMADRMPPEVRSLLDHVELHRDGNTIRFVASVSDSQLEALTKLGGL